MKKIGFKLWRGISRQIALLLVIVLAAGLASCARYKGNSGEDGSEAQSDSQISGGENTPAGGNGNISDGGDLSFGDDIMDTGAYDGYFEGDGDGIEIKYVSGTEGAYTLEGNTLTFTEVSEETVYSLSGSFKGNIVIDAGDDYKLEIELCGLSLVCDSTNPVTILSGDKVSISAKKGYKNYIYDMRDAIDDEDDSLYSAAVYSKVDLKISGKGELYVVSEHNNGIHTKDDLEVKNLTLLVFCADNALKGNDSVEINGGCTTLIATEGDGIKTKNSDISKKGNQRGSVTITGGEHNIYAGCDGIDAAYNVVIDDGETQINIYTYKYSSYSTNVEETDSASGTGGTGVTGNIPEMPEMPNGDMGGNIPNGGNMQNGGNMPNGEIPEKPDGEKPDGNAPSGDVPEMPDASGDRGNFGGNNGSFGGGFGGNFGGGMGGFGGMQEGNTEKLDISTKGIKADNEIIIENGIINIRSYDDAIHANSDVELENSEQATGNITVNGGTLTLYTNDDGMHADGDLCINDGSVTVSKSYEGLEGNTVKIAGGNISIYSSDDGINGVSESGTAIEISGGEVYVYCSGDGLDSNSTSVYSGIVFSGGKTVIISTGGGDSAIDTERGYSYTGGSVVAIMPQMGMTSEITHCRNFSDIGTTGKMSLSANDCLCVTVGEQSVSINMPQSLSAYIAVLGDSKAEINVDNTSITDLDGRAYLWK